MRDRWSKMLDRARYHTERGEMDLRSRVIQWFRVNKDRYRPAPPVIITPEMGDNM